MEKEKTLDTNPDISNLTIGFLNDLVRHLANFLESVSPSLHEDWWQHVVLDKLTQAQRQRIERDNINSVRGLDLPILLRVINSNWGEIAFHAGIDNSKQHFVKEMQAIRNRWAHANAEGYSADDIYRDLDTLQRFADLIGADKEFLDSIKKAKKDAQMINIKASAVNIMEPQGQKQSSTEEFSKGQIVSLKAQPEIKGAITKVIPLEEENRYEVFVNGEVESYFASQLAAKDDDSEHITALSCENFHAHLSALQIRHPGLSTLYSLNAARIEFVPYQFRPVLRFIRSDRPRLLIADSVGVGKTIEAGLILRELQARREVQSILIICPKPLVIESKWKSEMKRFEENFEHLDSKTLKYCIKETDLDGIWPQQYRRAIVPYSLFDEALLLGSGKNKKGLLNLDPPPRFDLVIVDEAHHIRNSETYRHRAVRFFCDNSEATIFLTATPIQLGNRDLFILLNCLRPDLIIDEKSFEHMAEPNPYINEAVSLMRQKLPNWQKLADEQLQKAENTGWGQSILKKNPEFRQLQSSITQSSISDNDRVDMITKTERMHTFSHIINRTRRRDIEEEFTKRSSKTVEIPFTLPQKELHDAILKLQAEIFAMIHDNKQVNFMMSTIRRQAASCLYGLIPFLEIILTRNLGKLELDTADDESIENEEAIEWNDIKVIEEQIQTILDMTKALPPQDPKFEALCDIIRDKQKMDKNKLMLFSSFRHTLKYLYDGLKSQGFRVGIMHGGTPEGERIELREQFEKPKEEKDALDVMLFSEIGCEGLDYQFCDCMVNYDLPWNPMRIEQRIGRIDRKGQKSPAVAIYNLITPGTVDADIYERCLMRIGIFEQALGGSEEILGEITQEIKNIAENYKLSEEDKITQLQQLADNKIRKIQEETMLEDKQAELFGIQLPKSQIDEDIEAATSFWLSPDSLHRLVLLYLHEKFGKEQEYILGEKTLKTLRLSQASREELLKDFQKLERRAGQMYQDWEKWLKGSEQHLLITFESQCAADNRKSAFIMPLHPLVKQAAAYFDKKRKVTTKLQVKSRLVPAGCYEFAIYQWKFYGIKEDLILQSVSSSAEITERLNKLLTEAKDAPDSMSEKTIGDKALDKAHYGLWDTRKKEHVRQVAELVGYRKQSLYTSHNARMSVLNEQLAQAQNEKIQRMRKSQIDSAQAEYERLSQELDIAAEKADIAASVVAYGILYVE